MEQNRRHCEQLSDIHSLLLCDVTIFPFLLGNSPSGTTNPGRLEMPLPTSGKTPVHDPKSPLPSPGFPPPCMERSDMGANSNGVPLQGNEKDELVVVDSRPNEITGVESDKDARLPVQEAPAAEDALLSEMENMKERPQQESGFPKKSTGHPPVAGDESLSSDKDARRPMQEMPGAQKSPESVEFENMKERPVQESKSVTSDSSGKEARRPTQESPEKLSPGLSKEENMEEKPIQELADEKRSEETAVQESEETPKKDEESRDHPVRHVYHEGDLKELTKETLAQETTNQSGEETKHQSPEHQVKEGEGEDVRPLKDDECSDEKPLEASTRRETESKGSPEEALPTQETMAAGKGPFEETEPEVGVKGHPTD